MNILTSNAHFRQRVIKRSYKYGVTEASKYYRISRQAIYEWRHKYDGKSWKSLIDKSHRPHHHPNEHKQEEKDMILRHYPRYKECYGLLCVKRDIHAVMQVWCVL